MSQDQARFEALGRLEASEPLCEMSVRAPIVPDVKPVERLTVESVKDGGFLVMAWASFPGSAEMLFAAGTIQEVCEYLEDRFS